jgi:N utilization substance protein A
MSRKLKKGYFVKGQFVAEGSALDLEYKRELKGTDEPTRTDLKRESLEIQKLGEDLLTLRGELFQRLGLPDKLSDAVAEAKRVLFQSIRALDDEKILGEFSHKKGDLISGVIQQSSNAKMIHVLIGKNLEAVMPSPEQVAGEDYTHGKRIRVVITDVKKGMKGPSITVSRHHPDLVRRLFELEVPEIGQGLVKVAAISRHQGHRTKIAVFSNDSNVDPVGACVGARGARVRMVVNELRGEKIDIVPFSDEPADFVMKALSPAKVKEVRIHEDTGTAEVIVPDYQLSLAIGKEGQNARLAARLTGWRVDIKSETQLAEEEAYANQDWAEGEWVVDAETGEQVWQPAEGGEAMSAEAYAQAAEDVEETEAEAEAEVVAEAEAIVEAAEAEAAEETGSEDPA